MENFFGFVINHDDFMLNINTVYFSLKIQVKAYVSINPIFGFAPLYK